MNMYNTTLRFRYQGRTEKLKKGGASIEKN